MGFIFVYILSFFPIFYTERILFFFLLQYQKMCLSLAMQCIGKETKCIQKDLLKQVSVGYLTIRMRQ